AVKIDDTQADDGDRRVFDLRLTPIVGTAMLDCHAHRGHVRPHGASISARIKLYPTANTTHDWQLILTHPNRLTRSILLLISVQVNFHRAIKFLESFARP